MTLQEVAKKWFRPPLLKIRSIFRMTKYMLVPSRFLSPIENFRKDGWNRILWDSVPTSPPLDIIIFGGFVGVSVQEWLNRVPHSRIHVFEPMPVFANELEKKFRGQDVVVHAFGVGPKLEEREFRLLGDATFLSSLERDVVGRNDASTHSVLFRPATEVALLLPKDIGVMEINIEGGEYELIPLLSETGILGRTNFLFVQFHDVGQGTSRSIRTSRVVLEESHEMVWCYELVWELWKRRD